jgi:hypothetical protein
LFKTDREASLQMSDSMSGSLVFKLEPLAPAAQVLRINDVVLAIEGVAVADDGTIEFRDEERVDFAFQVRGKHVGARGLSRAGWVTRCVGQLQLTWHGFGGRGGLRPVAEVAGTLSALVNLITTF